MRVREQVREETGECVSRRPLLGGLNMDTSIRFSFADKTQQRPRRPQAEEGDQSAALTPTQCPRAIRGLAKKPRQARTRPRDPLARALRIAVCFPAALGGARGGERGKGTGGSLLTGGAREANQAFRARPCMAGARAECSSAGTASVVAQLKLLSCAGPRLVAVP